MSVRLLEVAQHELDEAITWYASQAPGLGDAFLLEAVSVFELIQRTRKLGIRCPTAFAAAACAVFPMALFTPPWMATYWYWLSPTCTAIPTTGVNASKKPPDEPVTT